MNTKLDSDQIHEIITHVRWYHENTQPPYDMLIEHVTTDCMLTLELADTYNQDVRNIATIAHQAMQRI